MHVNFLENKSNITGSGPEWLFDIDSLTNSMNYQSVSVGIRTNDITGSKIHSDAGQKEKEKVSDQEYILLPVLNASSNVPLSNEEVVSSPKNNNGKKLIVEPTHVEGCKIDDLGCLDQQMKSTDDFENTNSTNSFNIASLTVNIASDKDGTFQRTYGIHKDHPKEQIIREVNSDVQTRKMAKQNEAGLVTLINKKIKTNHKDFQTSLSACFLSQMEPKKTKIHVDNESAICVVKNPVHHSKSKHIEIRHHFIRDSYKKRLIEMVKIHTDSNIADLLTKAFDVTRFEFLVASIEPFSSLNNFMANLKFIDRHTMVAYLEKSDDNTEFHHIVDFLSSCSITYALTAVVISKSLARSDLLFDDEDGGHGGVVVLAVTSDDGDGDEVVVMILMVWLLCRDGGCGCYGDESVEGVLVRVVMVMLLSGVATAAKMVAVVVGVWLPKISPEKMEGPDSVYRCVCVGCDGVGGVVLSGGGGCGVGTKGRVVAARVIVDPGGGGSGCDGVGGVVLSGGGGCGVGTNGRVVAARVIVDPVDRLIRIVFGFGRKARRKSFSAPTNGGGGDRRRLVVAENI
uniref:Putative ribonuclease H-like domain-containing protein n=1 Tax=Tanacetum cinerariifolium TaxID=118510 RepID=A0A6L2NCL5_TANCI|nr:putative ribonuclease H-like domain-containing protein [Tanacetum cinerariifolium]